MSAIATLDMEGFQSADIPELRKRHSPAAIVLKL
jgi:hypothetical protein